MIPYQALLSIFARAIGQSYHKSYHTTAEKIFCSPPLPPPPEDLIFQLVLITLADVNDHLGTSQRTC